MAVAPSVPLNFGGSPLLKSLYVHLRPLVPLVFVPAASTVSAREAASAAAAATAALSVTNAASILSATSFLTSASVIAVVAYFFTITKDNNNENPQ